VALILTDPLLLPLFIILSTHQTVVVAENLDENGKSFFSWKTDNFKVVFLDQYFILKKDVKCIKRSWMQKVQKRKGLKGIILNWRTFDRFLMHLNAWLHKGSSINDVKQFWKTFYNPSPFVTINITMVLQLLLKNLTPSPKTMMSFIDGLLYAKSW